MNLVHNEMLMATANERYRAETTALKHENHKLADCLRQRRANRERRVLQRVAGELRELNYEGDVKLAELEAQYKEQTHLRRGCERERERHAQMLAEFGAPSAGEVFGLYPEVWDSPEARKDRRNYS